MTVFLIRHASAGRRGFDQDDHLRQLDEYGIGQATALADFLDGREIEEIHSSPAVRCRETVGPLAASTGLTVTDTAVLFEGSSIGRVMEFIRSFDSRNVAMCSHGDIIPEVIRAIEVGGTRVAGERRCAKGSIWELDISAGGMIEQASYRPVEPAG